MAKATKKDKVTQVRMNPETHARFRDLASKLGVSQIALLRTLSFATAEEFMTCEQRRLDGPRNDESG